MHRAVATTALAVLACTPSLCAERSPLVRRVLLGYELPGVRFEIITIGGGWPIEAFERLRVTSGSRSFLVGQLNDLRGFVRIPDAAAALRYVRLLTSVETDYLWHRKKLEKEILDIDGLLAQPDYGLREHSVLFYVKERPRRKSAESRRICPANGPARDRAGANVPDRPHASPPARVRAVQNARTYDIDRSGMDGVLSSRAYGAGRFTRAAAAPHGSDFVVTRWLFVERYRGHREIQTVQQVREVVSRGGLVTRTVLLTREPPELPGTVWHVPKRE